MNACSIARTLLVLLAVSFAGVPAAARSTVAALGEVQDETDRVESQIKRLELGLSALEELGRREDAARLRRVVDELRGSLARERENEEVRTVRRRLAVMRTAVQALVEADRRDAAELVERAMRARELSLEGRRDEEANRIRAAAPDRAQLAEVLGLAARLYAEWERPERAGALAELAETYAAQGRRRQGAASEERPERDGEAGRFQELGQRIEALRAARVAFDRAGHETAEGLMRRFLHLAELQSADADEEALERAREGLSIGVTIELLQKASGLYAEWGERRPAAACNGLAEFYAARERAKAADEGAEPAPDRPESRDLDDRAHRMEILRLARIAYAEAGNEEGDKVLERALHLAELQHEGAGAERIAEAAQGISMERIVERLLGASELYHGWGHPDRASACYALAEYYAQREAASTPQTDESAAARAVLERLMQQTAELEQEIRQVHEALRKLIER